MSPRVTLEMGINSFLSYRDLRWTQGNGSEPQTPTHRSGSRSDDAECALRLCVLKGTAENRMERTVMPGAQLPGHGNCVTQNV